MYNNFSSKKTKKVISALLASALVVTSAPITADAATSKVLGVKKTFTVAGTKVTGLSKAEKKVVKVTIKNKKVTVKGLKAGKVTFKIGKKAYTVKVGATKVALTPAATSLKVNEKTKVAIVASNGKNDKLTVKTSNNSIVKISKSSVTANASGKASITLKGLAAGTSKITVTSKNTGKTASVKINVVADEVVTQAPVVSDSPVVSGDPSTSQAPVVSGDPSTSQAPATSNDPNASQAPSVTTGTITATPEATATPATHAAVVVSAAAVAGDTSIVLPGTNVPANSSLFITYDKALDATSVITGNITVTKDGVKQLASVTYNSAKKAIVITLKDALFDAGATYVVAVNGVKDADGYATAAYNTTVVVSTTPIIKSATFGKYNSLAAAGSKFTATNLDGAVVDGESMTLDRNYDGKYDAGDNDTANTTAQEVITLKFNKDMNASSLTNDANIKILDVTTGTYLVKTIVGGSAKTSSVQVSILKTALTANHEYKMTVSGMSALDGTVMAEQSYKFFYGITAPAFATSGGNDMVFAGDRQYTTGNASVTNVFGNLKAYGGSSAFTFKAQLDKDVDAATVNTDTIVIIEKATGTVVDTTVAYEKGSRYIVVTPKNDLKEETVYQITFNGIKTDKGLAMTKDVRTFTTGDFNAPTVVSVTPANGTDEVALNKSIEIKFNEGMDTTTMLANLELKDLTDKSVDVMTITDYYTTVFSQDGTTLTLKNIKELTVGHTYQLTIKGDGHSGVSDDSTNYLEANYVVKFATVSPTTTYVKDVRVDGYASTDATVETGTMSFDKNKSLNFTFDKAVSLPAGVSAGLTLEKKAAGATVWTTANADASAGAVTLTNSDKTVVLAPNSTWDVDTLYKVTLSGLKDVNGNDVKDQVFQFTVGTKPSFVTSNPAEFSTTTAVNQSYMYAVLADTESDLDVSTINAENVKFVKKADQSAVPYTYVGGQYAKATTNVDSITNTAYESSLAAVTASNTITVSAGENYVSGMPLLIVGGGTGENYNVHVVSYSSTTLVIDRAITTTASTSIYETILDSSSEFAASNATAYGKFVEGKLYEFAGTSGKQYAVVTGKTAAGNKIKLSNDITCDGTVTIKEAQGVVYKLNDNSKLDPKTEYQLVIKGVKDKIGNEIDATTKTFTTAGDVQVLKFVSSSVEDGAVNVPVDTKVELTMNEEVTDVTFDASSSKTTADGSVNCLDNVEVTDVTINKVVTNRFDITKSGAKITVEAKGLLVAGHVYKIELKSALQSATAGTFDGKTISFQAEATASVKPKLVSAKALDTDKSGSLDANEKIILTFDKELDSSTAQVIGNYGLSSGYTFGGGSYTPGTHVKLQDDKKTIVITLVSNASAPTILPGITTIKVNKDTVKTVSDVYVDDTAVVIQ